MFEKQLEKLTEVMVDNGQCSLENKYLVLHGLTAGVELLFNIISTLIIGSILGMFIESILFLIVFPFIRSYAGGYHCKDSISCYFSSVTVLLLVLLLVKYVPTYYSLYMSIVLLTISVPTILKLAPVDTIQKKLDEYEYRHFRKKTLINLMIEFIFIIILIAFNMYSYAFLVSISVFVVAMMLIAQLTERKVSLN